MQYFPVDADRSSAVEQARAAVQNQPRAAHSICKGRQAQGTGRSVEDDMRFRLRQVGQQEMRGVGGPRLTFHKRGVQALDHRRGQGTGMPRRGLTTIGIASGKLNSRRKIGEEGLQQLLVRRRAKADRVGDALANGRSFMRHAGWQVQHVAGVQYDFVGRPEVSQQLQWCALDCPQIALATDAPAPPSMGLQQEYIVGVDVRADTAAVRGVTDHQVVEPRIGDETEPL